MRGASEDNMEVSLMVVVDDGGSGGEFYMGTDKPAIPGVSPIINSGSMF